MFSCKWLQNNILKIKNLENGSAIESDGGEIINPEIIEVFALVLYN